MVSTCPLISKSSSPFTNPLGIVPSALFTIEFIVTFMFHSVLSSLARSRYLFLFSLSFNFTLWSAEMAKSTIRQFLFFLSLFLSFYFLKISLRLAEIRWSVLYLKIPEKFVRLILQDIFWVVYIPLVRMVKLKFLAQFSEDYLPNLLLLLLLLLLSLLFVVVVVVVVS